MSKENVHHSQGAYCMNEPACMNPGLQWFSDWCSMTNITRQTPTHPRMWRFHPLPWMLSSPRAVGLLRLSKAVSHRWLCKPTLPLMKLWAAWRMNSLGAMGDEANDFGKALPRNLLRRQLFYHILPDDVATRSPQVGLPNADTEPSQTPPTIIPDYVAAHGDPQARLPGDVAAWTTKQSWWPECRSDSWPNWSRSYGCCEQQKPAKGAGPSEGEKRLTAEENSCLIRV